MAKQTDFRRAEMQDAALLLAWRNDERTRAQSLQSQPIALEEHIEWLNRALVDPQMAIFLFLVEGEPAGVLRGARDEQGTWLSWTVSPAYRGRGIGREMLVRGVGLFPKPQLARILPQNQASKKIAEAAGFGFIGQDAQSEIWKKN